jgi:hypothetical protein
MFPAYLPVHIISQAFNFDCETTNRIEGGEPDGISTRPGDSGCRKSKTSNNIIAAIGNIRTTTRGIEIVFMRIRRRRRALGEKRLPFCETSPNEEGKDGFCRFFEKYCRKPIRDFWWRGWVGGGEASTSSRIVSGMLTFGGFGRDTVERRRALSRPFDESTLEG